jgi:hypothetical protein
VTVFRAFYKSQGAALLKDGSTVGARPVRAFSGIANPEGFYDSLSQLGFVIAGKHAYPDHYSFTETEVLALIAAHPGELYVYGEGCRKTEGSWRACMYRFRGVEGFSHSHSF